MVREARRRHHGNRGNDGRDPCSGDRDLGPGPRGRTGRRGEEAVPTLARAVGRKLVRARLAGRGMHMRGGFAGMGRRLPGRGSVIGVARMMGTVGIVQTPQRRGIEDPARQGERSEPLQTGPRPHQTTFPWAGSKERDAGGKRIPLLRLLLPDRCPEPAERFPGTVRRPARRLAERNTRVHARARGETGLAQLVESHPSVTPHPRDLAVPRGSNPARPLGAERGGGDSNERPRRPWCCSSPKSE